MLFDIVDNGNLKFSVIKENSNDFRNTKVVDIYKELTKNKCIVNIYDPYVNKLEVYKTYKINLIENLKLNYYEALYHAKRSDGSEVELIDAPDTIINTSCEHIKEFERWYLKLPKEKLVILQSNDYFTLPEHINCVKDLDEFKEQCPMKTLLYSGVLESKSYNRFMLIGII